MDRQYQPVHLKARVHELEEEEVLELEALLEQNKAAEVTNQRLEELRVRPGSQLEWEYLEQAVQEWKKEKHIQPKKKPRNWKKFKLPTIPIKKVLQVVGISCLVVSGVGLAGYGLYAMIEADYKESQFIQSIDLNCDGDLQLHEFAKAYEYATGKKFPESVLTEKNQSTLVRLSLDDTVKGIDITIHPYNSIYNHGIKLSNATAQQIAEKYKDKAVCRLSL